MPRISRKRKAAILRCVQRKKKAKYNGPDLIRASAGQESSVLAEIVQPDVSIGESYMDRREETSFEPPDSDMEEYVLLPPLDVEIKTPSSERLETSMNSVATELPTGYEELPLPDTPFDGTLEMEWAEYNASEFSIPSLFSCTATTNSNEWKDIRSDQSFQDEVGNQLSASSWNVSFTRELFIEPELPSPILAETSEPALLSHCPIERVARSSMQFPASNSTETQHDCSSNSILQDDVYTEHRMSTTSVETLANDSVIQDNSNQSTDNRFEEILDEPRTLQQRRITLTISETTIINIPGTAPEGQGLEDSDCNCEACIKCAAFNQQSLGTEKEIPERDVEGDETTKRRMREIYDKFNQVDYPTGVYDSTQSFAKTATKPPRKTAATARRYNAVCADVFSQADIPKWKPLIGRRIIDYDYFVKWIITAQAVHSRSFCPGILCPQQEIVKCMTSTLWLMCNVCSIVVKGSSEEPSRGTRLRFSTSWAILSTGSTYTMAHDLFSFLNIPFMGNKAFSKDETAMDVVLENALQESLQKAVEEEVNLASQEIKDKQLPENTPLNLCCELDGSWGQRSNGHRYSSASGCAAMIGTRSKKVVFIGTRNKRCFACKRNAARLKSNQRITPHKCYKNYTGSSGGMESDIIIEGFRTLYEKGIKFTTIITDGDSTTVSKLKNNCEYGHEIQHQLCCNHTIKNAGKKLREIKCPKQLADQVSCRLDRLTKGVRSAIKHCADNGSKDVEGLRHDIRNVPYHVFGNHSSCREYFCVHKDESYNNPSIISDLQKSGVWDKIAVIMEKLASKAEFLCENKTSNLAENLFCRLCKYNVGKRIDTMSRGSYQRRVQISALMCNEGYLWHDVYMEIFTGESPGFWTKKMFVEKARSLEQTRRAQKNPNFSRRSRNAPREIEMDYGEEAVEAAENAARENIVLDIDAIRKQYQIQDSTKMKLKNCITITEMEELAKGRILSKFVPDIINARESSKWKKCETLLQTTNTWNFLKTNRAVVGLVLRVLHEQHALDFDENKMFIDPCHEFLCCVPDAVSKDGSTILLIRKKESAGDIEAQASTSKGVLGCKLKEGEVTLDRKTTLEVQAALHVCSSTRCLIFFMLGSNVGNHLLKFVDRDEESFGLKIEPKLNGFFNDYFLKKIIEKQITIKQ